MKKTSKALLLALCAVLLVAASVMGTMAYLTSTDSVENTFTVGKVAITLDEAAVSTDGVELKDLARRNSNTYHLLPGHEYMKDPTVHVSTDSEECYLFVKVTNPLTPIEDAMTVADQMKAKGWLPVADVDNVYVYVGTSAGANAPLAVAGGTDVTVFETVKVRGDVDNATLARYKDGTITVVAYAIQKDGLDGKTAAEIFDLI